MLIILKSDVEQIADDGSQPTKKGQAVERVGLPPAPK